MKRLGFVSAFCSVVLLALCLVPVTGSAIENDKPGSFYFGDSGDVATVDGTLTSGDLSQLKQVLLGSAGSFGGCRPPVWEVQDLYPDGVVGSGDLSILQKFLLEQWSSDQGARPQQLFVMDGATPVSSGVVNITVDGSTTTLSAFAIDDSGVYDGTTTRRPGWGLLFEIDPTGSCTTAVLNGHTAFGGGVYQQTWSYADDALATITIEPGGCANGSTLLLNVRIPDDTEAGNFGQRFTSDLLWSGTVVGSVSTGTTCTPSTMSCDLASVTEGETATYTCTDDCGNDVTADTSVSGDCTGGAGDITALENNCDSTDGSCSIDHSLASDSVTRTDDGDAIDGLTCDISSVTEGTSDTYTCGYTWNEGTCTTAATADSSVSGDCTGGAGTITGLEDNCSSADGACTIGASGTSATEAVTRTDDGDARTGITCDISSVGEGASDTYTCNEVWTEATCADVTSGTGVSGDCSGGGGTITGLEDNCSSADGSCTISESGDTHGVTRTDDGDARTGITCNISEIQEEATDTYTCNEQWSESVCGDVTSTTNVSGDCTGGSGSITGNNVCGDTDPSGSCTISESGDNHGVTLRDDGDTIQSTLISPDPANVQEGNTQAFVLTRTWSDSCTEDLSENAGWSVISGTCSPTGTMAAQDGTGGEYDGLYTAPNVSSDCSEQVDNTAADSAVTVNVGTTCTPTLSCSISSVGEGASDTYTCDNSCGTDVTADTSVTGDCTGGAGTITGTEDNCSSADGSCSIDHSTLGSESVTRTDDGDSQTGITCDLSSVGEGATDTYTCNEQWSESVCGDVTSTSSVSGDCTGGGGTITGSEDNCSSADGSCAINESGFSHSVTRTDDGDARTGITCDISSVGEGATDTYTCNEQWSESVCGDVTSGTGVSGDCTGGAGSITGLEDNCSSADGSCTISESGDNHSVTRTDDGDARTGITCDISSVGEGATDTYTCNEQWSESVCGDVTSGTGVSGDCTGGAGSITGLEDNCSSADGSCTISESGDTHGVTRTDDGDSRTGITCDISSVGEGATDTYTCNEVWTEATCGDVTSGTGVSGDCTGGGGSITGLEDNCSSADGSCTISESGDTHGVTRTDDGDAISGLTCDISSITEGTSDTYTCDYTWNEGTCTTAATADSSVSGDCTGSAGSITALEENCDMTDGSCTIGASGTSDTHAVTRTDDDTPTVDVTPNGPHTLNDGDTLPFDCTITWNEGTCPSDCSSSLTDQSGCGSLDASGVYTAANGDCTDVVSGNSMGASDGETVNVNAVTGAAPVISSVFPLDAGDSFRLNAHAADQPLTVVFDDATGDAPTSMPGTSCVSTSDASKVSLSCDLSGYPDVKCTPASAYNSRDTYNCTVGAENGDGSDSASGSMSTSIREADVTSFGGMAEGYIGGGTYDSTAGKPVNSTVDIYAVERESGNTIGGNVYIQIIQGSTLREYFTDSTGHLSVELDTMPIDELTMGYKCGAESCSLNTPSDASSWYKYVTYTDINARTIYMQLSLMSDMQRNATTVSGTIPLADFNSWISATRNRQRARQLFLPPTHLRGAIVISTLKDIYAVTNLDALLQLADDETSISLCLDPDTPIRYSTTFALYPNLVAPDIIIESWNTPCDGRAANPGQSRYEYKIWEPNSYNVLWSVGAYANATKFSLTGELNLLDFPIYVTSLGIEELDLTSWDGTSPNTASGRSVEWLWDMRENWTQDGLGYVGDAPDTRTQISMNPVLPVDPARAGARVGDTSGRYLGYPTANASDSGIGGSSNWRHRFLRSSPILVSGADYGDPFGLGVTGLSFTSNIDDADFTMFRQSFTQSTPPRMGKRNEMPWANSTGDTEVPGIEHGFPASSWGTTSTIPGVSHDGVNFDFTSRADGGPANYAAIAVVSRGNWTKCNMSDPTLDGTGGVPTNDGSLISVYSVGSPESVSSVRIDDYMNAPVPVSPSRSAYIYPAPQWANSIGNSSAYNRNGELWPDETVDSSNALETDSNDDWNRYYFEFTNPGLTHNTSGTIHLWQISLSDGGRFTFDGTTATGSVGKHSIRTQVKDSLNPAAGNTARSGHYVQDNGMQFYDEIYPRNGRFDNWGVQPGDSLVLWDRGRRCYISAVTRGDMTTSGTPDTITVDPGQSSNCGTSQWSDIMPSNNGGNVHYSVYRANPQGECGVDPYNYGGPTGYGCSGNSFWDVFGPVTGTGNIVAHVPDITSGQRTLDGGRTAFVPNFWEGSTTPLGSPAVTGAQLKWSYDLFVYNTDNYTNGGIGHAFDYNNYNIHTTELSSQFVAVDSAYFLLQ